MRVVAILISLLFVSGCAEFNLLAFFDAEPVGLALVDPQSSVRGAGDSGGGGGGAGGAGGGASAGGAGQVPVVPVARAGPGTATAPVGIVGTVVGTPAGQAPAQGTAAVKALAPAQGTAGATTAVATNSK